MENLIIFQNSLPRFQINLAFSMIYFNWINYAKIVFLFCFVLIWIEWWIVIKTCRSDLDRNLATHGTIWFDDFCTLVAIVILNCTKINRIFPSFSYIFKQAIWVSQVRLWTEILAQGWPTQTGQKNYQKQSLFEPHPVQNWSKQPKHGIIT